VRQRKVGRGTGQTGNLPSGVPRVSIVIISYNYARFLREAIHSALGQTYRDLEIIIVDDGSSDGSRRIIEEFRDRAAVIFQANRGETSAVNAGFAASGGDIVMFLDSDDMLRPTAVEEAATAWRPGLAKVQFGLEIIDAEGRSTGAIEPVYPLDYTPEKVRREFMATNTYSWPPTSGNAFSRAFLSQVMPLSTEEFPFAPDGALNTIAPLFGEIATLAKPLGVYRIHGNNMWAPYSFAPAKFEHYLEQRQREVSYLRGLAGQRGIALSASDPLNHSLPFLRYRLAAAKLNRRRTRPGVPGTLGICLLAARYLSGLDLSRRQRAAELLWFVLVGLSFGRLARHLIELRFVSSSRPPWVRRVLDRFGVRPFGRVHGEPKATSAASDPTF
jgi:glycosyltransferase involved in cell wall biosynthesis